MLIMPFAGKSRKILLGTAVLFLIAGWLLWNTRLGRAVLGQSTFVIANNSGSDLKDVRLELRPAGARIVTKHFSTITKGSSEAVRVTTSDLYMDSLQFSLNGERKEYSHMGLATKGEILVFSVEPGGTINTFHDWRMWWSHAGAYTEDGP